jgi:hypothetical protein
VGLALLRRAHELMPNNARYAYLYAVALNSKDAGEAITDVQPSVHLTAPAPCAMLSQPRTRMIVMAAWTAAAGHSSGPTSSLPTPR